MGAAAWPVVAAAIAAVVAAAMVWGLRDDEPTGPSVWDVQAELPHRAHRAQPSITQAMKDVHEHRHCQPRDCGRRRAALRVLYEDRRINLPEALYAQVYEQTE
ncbi:hypothetical protein [Nocardia tengchongensis]|uniref:hypothetical protein n=1 Tax=Nocardia tengchongensis TaxID=2055889 RepID=UPI003614CAEE